MAIKRKSSSRREETGSRRGERKERSGSRRGAFITSAAEGFAQSERELEAQQRRREEAMNSSKNPFRFYCPVGEEREIIIVDEEPTFFRHEHALRDSQGRWNRVFTGCIKATDDCPVCRAEGKESYYAMYLTCIDLTPFETRNGDEVEFSRKLLVVKVGQHKKFARILEREGTLRGARLLMARDSNKGASIGDDIEFLEFVDEDELVEYVREWTDNDGKDHEEECFEPYDYREMFEEPTAEELRKVVGGGPTPGSREHDENELRSGRGARKVNKRRRRDEDDDEGWEPAEDSGEYGEDEKPSRRKVSKRRRMEEDEEESAPFNEDENEGEEEPLRKARASSEKTPGSRRRPVIDEGDEEDNPPRRKSSVSRRGSRK